MKKKSLVCFRGTDVAGGSDTSFLPLEALLMTIPRSGPPPTWYTFL